MLGLVAHLAIRGVHTSSPWACATSRSRARLPLPHAPVSSTPPGAAPGAGAESARSSAAMRSRAWRRRWLFRVLNGLPLMVC